MSLFHRIIYTPKINWLVRNINYAVSPLLPKWIKIHPSGKLKVKVKSHSSFYLQTNQTSFLTRELFWKNAENFEYSDIFIGLIKKVESFFDIGANIGYYSILGCTVNPNLKAYAFEPSIGVLHYLRENIKLNALSRRVIAEPIALSDAKGEIDFFEIKNPKFPNINNLSGEHNIGTKDGKITQKIKVQTLTLDEYVAHHKIEQLDFVKLDTEGAEAMILRGSSRAIEAFRPIIVSETLFHKIEGDLEDIMTPFGYIFFNHTVNGLEKVASIRRSKDDGVRNCFFVPSEKIHLIEEWVV